MSVVFNDAHASTSFSSDIAQAVSSIQTFKEEQPLTLKLPYTSHGRIPSFQGQVNCNEVYCSDQQTMRITDHTGKVWTVAEIDPINLRIVKKQAPTTRSEENTSTQQRSTTPVLAQHRSKARLKTENQKGYLNCLFGRIMDSVNSIFKMMNDFYLRIVPWTNSLKQRVTSSAFR